MERGETWLDAGDGATVSPTSLSAPFVIHPKPNYCREEYEMEGGNIEFGNNMGNLSFLPWQYC